MTTLLMAISAEGLLSADLSLLVVLAIFIVLVYALDAIIFQPILKVLDQRERLTTGAVDEAKKAAHDYDKQLANYEEKIRAARAESYKMLEDKRKTALDERTQKLAQVKQAISDKISASKQEITNTTGQAKTKLESESIQIAQSIAHNLLKRPLGGAF
ncbi:MAG: ATP synthase F0 subunit B [Blastocatellia bacterium]|nr:ATP synthase F0 subunit B [Blastocatellia bacterium]MBL8192722.1 ATP synthase F0 subunit B [Blastocatellia bacterium]MBN8723101.1 ATP synthase F0 subunit B [Acidobacteriota bacterium]